MIFDKRIFADIDVLLRRGGHIGRSDFIQYEFISTHFMELKGFYNLYNCELIQHPDGFYYLFTEGDVIQSRIIPKSCMHLGMFIALRMRDPEITATLGRIPLSKLLSAIETSIPRDTLQEVYAPKRREALQYEKISSEIMRALRMLQSMRFLKIVDEIIIPTEAIARFTELARYDNTPDALATAIVRNRGVVIDVSDDNEYTAEIVHNDEDDYASEDR